MPVLSSFSLPAFIEDIPTDTPANQALNAELKWRWNVNVTGWIAQAMPGAPSFFYDPTATDIPTGSQSAPVTWNAFPGRLAQFYSASPPNSPANPYKLTQDQVYSLADTGFYPTDDGELSFQDIPQKLCPEADWNPAKLQTFGPYGPRGWLDEYCEWSAARDTNGNLVRIDFACENPEYWTTLWKVSPETVASLYQSILNWDAPADRQISVALEDLQLTVGGAPVIDPETGRPAYNPLNKWNTGPVAFRTGAQSGFSGGVIHLTSTPNTLQTELGLAGASTVQVTSGNSDQQALICCAKFGQEYRHSDPHIGQSVNAVVSGALTQGAPQKVCLADPVGLYIQPLNNPSSFGFRPGIEPAKLSGASASDVFQIVRGSASVTDPVTGAAFPGAMILHVVCQIPSAWLTVYPDLTLADIQIGGASIAWAGQVAAQFNIGLYARPLGTETQLPQPPQDCSSGLQTPLQPLQSLMFTTLWDAYYNGVETAPTGQTMSLASNTTFIAPLLAADGQAKALTLTVNPSSSKALPTVAVLLADGSGPDPSISVTVLGSSEANYAVPGNSYPGAYTALALEVSIPAGAAPGLRGVSVTDPSGTGGGSLPAALYILSGE